MSMIWKRLRSGEQGMSLVFVSLTLMSLLSASMLAIDLGMLMTARAQAQNAADAGAQAGAVALMYNDYNDRSTGGPAVQNALAAGRANQVMGSSISLDAGDVTFVNDPTGQPNWVRVNVFRSGSRGNPLTGLIAPFFGTPNSDINATAVAEAAPANAATCVLPFAIADRWTERQTPAWDVADSFNAYPVSPSTPPDIYNSSYSDGYTGFKVSVDKGLELTMRAGTGTQISSSYYYAVALPGGSSAADYKWNISHCNTGKLDFFAELTAMASSMAGPTAEGIADLVALDPNAHWDDSAHKVVSSMNPSPRVKLMPVFDPYYYHTGRKNGHPADLKASNFVGVFVEGMSGSTVVGRIVPAPGIIKTGMGPAPSGGFPRVIRIVE